MATQLKLGEIVAEVTYKDIKNIHLSVYPPEGHVRISAPLRTSMDALRAYTVTKLDWIKHQQQKLRAQDRETCREYVDRESHYLWGKRYLLRVIEISVPPAVRTHGRYIELLVRPETPSEKREAIMDRWYRQHLKEAVLPLIKRWEARLGVDVERCYIQRMKTRWGSCSTRTDRIRLNTELAKKPLECVEYIVLHEMLHLLEPTHNQQFRALMDELMPKWRSLRDELNRLPVRHETWTY